MITNLTKQDTSALKGLAILFMIFHHCYRDASRFAGYVVNFAPFTQDSVVRFGSFCKVCVSIFAFVSGYGLLCGYKKIIGETAENKSRWVGKHIISSLCGFWLVAILSYFAYVILKIGDFSKFGENRLEKLFHVGIDVLGLSGIMGTPSLNGTWWYMSTAVVFIILLPILKAMADRFGYFVVMAMVVTLPRLLGIGFLGGRSAMSFLMIFVIGMMCADTKGEGQLLQQSKTSGGKALNMLVCLFALILGAWLCERLPKEDFWELKYAIVPFILIYFFVHYVFRIKAIHKVLAFLGKYSLNIWLIHTFIRDWCGPYIWRVSYFILVPLIIFVISLVLSMAIEGLKKVLHYNAWWKN